MSPRVCPYLIESQRGNLIVYGRARCPEGAARPSLATPPRLWPGPVGAIAWHGDSFVATFASVDPCEDSAMVEEALRLALHERAVFRIDRTEWQAAASLEPWHALRPCGELTARNGVPLEVEVPDATPSRIADVEAAVRATFCGELDLAPWRVEGTVARAAVMTFRGEPLPTHDEAAVDRSVPADSSSDRAAQGARGQADVRHGTESQMVARFKTSHRVPPAPKSKPKLVQVAAEEGPASANAVCGARAPVLPWLTVPGFGDLVIEGRALVPDGYELPVTFDGFTLTWWRDGRYWCFRGTSEGVPRDLQDLQHETSFCSGHPVRFDGMSFRARAELVEGEDLRSANFEVEDGELVAVRLCERFTDPAKEAEMQAQVEVDIETIFGGALTLGRWRRDGDGVLVARTVLHASASPPATLEPIAWPRPRRGESTVALTDEALVFIKDGAPTWVRCARGDSALVEETERVFEARFGPRFTVGAWKTQSLWADMPCTDGGLWMKVERLDDAPRVITNTAGGPLSFYHWLIDPERGRAEVRGRAQLPVGVMPPTDFPAWLNVRWEQLDEQVFSYVATFDARRTPLPFEREGREPEAAVDTIHEALEKAGCQVFRCDSYWFATAMMAQRTHASTVQGYFYEVELEDGRPVAIRCDEGAEVVECEAELRERFGPAMQIGAWESVTVTGRKGATWQAYRAAIVRWEPDADRGDAGSDVVRVR